MALHHAEPGEVVDLGPLGAALPEAHTTALVKTDSFEAIRLVLKEGETLPAHKVPGRFTLQCLEGQVTLQLPGSTRTLAAHQWIYLDAGVIHDLKAIKASSLLLTILFPT